MNRRFGLTCALWPAGVPTNRHAQQPTGTMAQPAANAGHGDTVKRLFDYIQLAGQNRTLLNHDNLSLAVADRYGCATTSPLYD